MSALRISRPGYPTEFVIQEPASAVVRGHGGSAMGFWSGTTLTVKQKRDNAPKKKLPRERKERPICGAPLGWRNQFTRQPGPVELCARIPGHTDSHRSRSALDNASGCRRPYRSDDA